jgi:class 3 adenylate cyclase
MQCYSCGTETSPWVKFCSECGKPVGVPCPKCGFRNAREAAVCGDCGIGLNHAYIPDAERRQLTVLFSDIVDSTSLIRSIGNDDWRELCERYHAMCSIAIRRYGGYRAQCLGDGSLAYFGYPGAHEDDAGRAVRSAMEILAGAGTIAEGGNRLSVRIGIDTGMVVMADLGDAERRERLALGEPPNIAARLQQNAPPDAVVISPETRNLLGGQFVLEDCGWHTLKGMSRPCQIYRVLGKSGAASRFHAMASTYSLTPLVGRERELQIIRKAWTQAVEGKGHTILLSGEAGIGKSRLLDAAGRLAMSGQHEVFQAQCSPYEVNCPLYPIVEMIERRLGIEPKMGEVDKLDRVEQFTAGRGVRVEEATPLLAGLLSISTLDRYPAGDLPPAKRHSLIIDLVADLLVRSVDGSPVLLLVEDIHWADPSTLDLLKEVIARLGDTPVLLVCTTRPDFTPDWAGGCEEITVQALTADETRTLVSRVAGPKHLPLALIQEVAARTGGVPLFTEAVTRTVMSSSELHELDDRYEMQGHLPPGLIPASVRDSLKAPIDRLGKDARVAQMAAAIGREFSFELLEEVLRMPTEQLTAALRHMVEMELVSEDGTPPASTYTFRHALIQEVAYESLSSVKTRPRFHDWITQALIRRFPDIAETKPELLARHHEGAGQIAKATDGWMKAGRQARKRLALRECEGHFRKAIQLLETLPEEDPARLQLEMEAQLALGQAFTETFGFASLELETAFTRARDLCMKLGNNEGLVQAMIGLSGMLLLRGNLSQALETANSVREMAIAAGNPMLRIGAGNLTSFPAYFLGDFMACCKYAEEALAVYTLESERALVVAFHIPSSFACAHIRATTLWTLGYVDQAERQWQEAWDRIEELNIDTATTFALGYMLNAHYLRRDVSAILAAADQAYVRADELGALFWASQARIHRGWARAMSGDAEGGIGEMKAALENYRLTGSVLNISTFCLMLAEGQERAGALEEALSSISDGLKHVAETQERKREAELYRLRGEILLSRGEVSAGEMSLRQGIEVARKQRAKMFEVRAAIPLGRLLIEQGRSGEARDLLRPLEDWFKEGRDTAEPRELVAILASMEGSDPNAPEVPTHFSV